MRVASRTRGRRRCPTARRWGRSPGHRAGNTTPGPNGGRSCARLHRGQRKTPLSVETVWSARSGPASLPGRDSPVQTRIRRRQKWQCVIAIAADTTCSRYPSGRCREACGRAATPTTFAARSVRLRRCAGDAPLVWILAVEDEPEPGRLLMQGADAFEPERRFITEARSRGRPLAHRAVRGAGDGGARRRAPVRLVGSATGWSARRSRVAATAAGLGVGSRKRAIGQLDARSSADWSDCSNASLVLVAPETSWMCALWAVRNSWRRTGSACDMTNSERLVW